MIQTKEFDSQEASLNNLEEAISDAIGNSTIVNSFLILAASGGYKGDLAATLIKSAADAKDKNEIINIQNNIGKRYTSAVDMNVYKEMNMRFARYSLDTYVNLKNKLRKYNQDLPETNQMKIKNDLVIKNIESFTDKCIDIINKGTIEQIMSIYSGEVPGMNFQKINSSRLDRPYSDKELNDFIKDTRNEIDNSKLKDIDISFNEPKGPSGPGIGR
jgi:hypothetical protein